MTPIQETFSLLHCLPVTYLVCSLYYYVRWEIFFPFYLHTFIFVCYDSTEGISLSIFTNCHTMYKMIWFSLNFLCILQTVHYMYFMAPLWLRLFPVYILWYIEFPQFFFDRLPPYQWGRSVIHRLLSSMGTWSRTTLVLYRPPSKFQTCKSEAKSGAS